MPLRVRYLVAEEVRIGGHRVLASDEGQGVVRT